MQIFVIRLRPSGRLRDHAVHAEQLSAGDAQNQGGPLRSGVRPRVRGPHRNPVHARQVRQEHRAWAELAPGTGAKKCF